MKNLQRCAIQQKIPSCFKTRKNNTKKAEGTRRRLAADFIIHFYGINEIFNLNWLII